MADNSIKISIELADAVAKKALGDFISQGDRADKSFKKLGETGSSTFQDIGVNIGKAMNAYDILAGNLAAQVVTKAFDAMIGSAKFLFNTLVVDGVKSAQESEDALNSLNVALGQAGIYSKETSKFFQDMANTIQDVTTLDDDLIIKNAALIESMTHLSKDGLAKATSAAVQLSAAFNIDLETASRNVAKAVDGNVTALKKLGLDFEVTGTKAGTYANVLKSIEQLNGSAESKLNTFSGAVAHAGNAFDDFRKEIGRVITENPVFVSAINKVSSILGVMSLGFSENQRSIMVLVGEGFTTLINGTKYLVQAFDVMLSGVRIAFNSIESVVFQTMGSIIAPLTLFSDKATEIWNAYKTKGEESALAVSNIFEKGGSLTEITKGLDSIGKAAEEGLDKLKSGAELVGPSVKNAKGSLSELTDEQIRSRKEIDSYVEGLAKQGDAVKTNYEQQLEQLNVFYGEKEVADTLADETNYTLKLERENQYFLDKQAARDQSLTDELRTIGQSTLAEDTKNKASLAAQKKYHSDSEKLTLEHDQKVKDFKAAEIKLETKNRVDRIQAESDLFGALGNLAAAGGKKGFEIAKAFNIASAITSAYAAIVKTLAEPALVYPSNIIASSAIGINAFANVARISSTPAPAFEMGGIVGGNSWTGDRLPIRVNSGEMILNRDQQTSLFKMANGQSGSLNSGLLDEIRGLRNDLRQQPISVQIEGREVANALRNQLSGGRTLS